ncbi:hypothetical protein K7711_46975 [Nocardia sp. CA2R105]|uniref:hypothetical protein n=1 Tax=Nocardia coffeae TaxID=2873381 RepID=UPI001CA6B35E|nr:hypothetical protein [Nocardia coffeae]MBY8864073.1 hypothetical protein [Nocardia coffeae]
MRMRAFVGAAAAAAAMSMLGVTTAHADAVNPNDYMIGDTVYFNVGYAQCSIKPDGTTGCDIAPGIAKWLGIVPVSDLAIDVAFLPAHPTFGLLGPYGRSDAKSLPNSEFSSTISYAGATCSGGGRGGVGCTSKGHSFSFGWSGTTTT